ncbi:hypothetical protein CROQUDRAFT_40179 [Cronartium quercuum f. sp. fusiforme G11]|uniref:Uncharacterized protein n=1 Tax=Cronartium quercuum f. sp. fusiforme G11 TaxID=708437 RepID=A0A9P6NL88_9BASI|nr:hypothetical protein CROQUDRAFT_40179 [Cronartium quercuum f. sp. fusiforme G11]
MAQGFKPKKVSSSTTKAQKVQSVKKGGRTVPPVKPSAVAQKLRKEKVSRDVTSQIERTVVSRSVGKLSIMKPLRDAEESKKEREKVANSKAKPRAATKK